MHSLVLGMHIHRPRGTGTSSGELTTHSPSVRCACTAAMCDPVRNALGMVYDRSTIEEVRETTPQQYY